MLLLTPTVALAQDIDPCASDVLGDALACLLARVPTLAVVGTRASLVVPGAEWTGVVERSGVVHFEDGDGAGLWLVGVLGEGPGIAAGSLLNGHRSAVGDAYLVLGRHTDVDEARVGNMLGGLDAWSAGMSAPLSGSPTVEGWSEPVVIPPGLLALQSAGPSDAPGAILARGAGVVGGVLTAGGSPRDARAIRVVLETYSGVPVEVLQQNDRLQLRWGAMASGMGGGGAARQWTGPPPPSTGWDFSGWLREPGGEMEVGEAPQIAHAREVLALVNEARRALDLRPLLLDPELVVRSFVRCELDGRLPSMYDLWSADATVLGLALHPGGTVAGACFGAGGLVLEVRDLEAVTGPIGSIQRAPGMNVMRGQRVGPAGVVRPADWSPTAYPPVGWYGEDYTIVWHRSEQAVLPLARWSDGSAYLADAGGYHVALGVAEASVSGVARTDPVWTPWDLTLPLATRSDRCEPGAAGLWVAERVAEGMSMDAARWLLAGFEGNVGPACSTAVDRHGPVP